MKTERKDENEPENSNGFVALLFPTYIRLGISLAVSIFDYRWQHQINLFPFCDPKSDEQKSG